MNKIRIVSDGTNNRTRVYLADGSELRGVTCIEILPIKGGKDELVQARITVEFFELDIEALAEDWGSK